MMSKQIDDNYTTKSAENKLSAKTVQNLLKLDSKLTAIADIDDIVSKLC